MSRIAHGEAFAARAATPRAERSAVRDGASHARLWLVAAIGLALDLWSKEWAFSTLTPESPRTIVKDVLDFQLSLNPGALFGMGAGFAPIFIGASVLALMFVLYLFCHSTPAHRWIHFGLGCVLAGALGNLYDRTMESAYVVYDTTSGVRHIGKLIDEGEYTVVVGDFKTGRNPRPHLRTPDVIAGHRPVVRDFIKIQAKVAGHSIWPWIFNVADALLVVGVAVLLLNFWLEHRYAEGLDEPAPAD
ncbi:MAG: signal peptidase II [Phycisphaerae bacterium]|nr:signal peptidase II [Phycisphaerae bacterium]